MRSTASLSTCPQNWNIVYCTYAVDLLTKERFSSSRTLILQHPKCIGSVGAIKGLLWNIWQQRHDQKLRHFRVFDRSISKMQQSKIQEPLRNIVVFLNYLKSGHFMWQTQTDIIMDRPPCRSLKQYPPTGCKRRWLKVLQIWICSMYNDTYWIFIFVLVTNNLISEPILCEKFVKQCTSSTWYVMQYYILVKIKILQLYSVWF